MSLPDIASSLPQRASGPAGTPTADPAPGPTGTPTADPAAAPTRASTVDSRADPSAAPATEPGAAPAAGPGAFATRAIHAGGGPEPATGAVVQPLYLSTTYAMDSPGVTRGAYDYARAGNPNRSALEATLAELEGADAAHAVSSGMAAVTAVFSALLAPGDSVVVPRDVYGGTVRLLEDEYARWGITIIPADIADPAALAAALAAGPALVWVETPSNPSLEIIDIAATARAAHAAGALLAVDNTFATPYLQQPLGLGADVVVHSTTKFCGGHSDVVGGAVLVKDHGELPAGAQAGARIDRWTASAGVGSAPFDAWLTARGLKTLAVRMERHCDSALRVARWLRAHPQVAEVRYPGLPDHPQHELAAAQMRGFGGIVTFRAASEAIALRAAERVRVFALAESLGGVESLFDHAATMTHLCLRGTELEVGPDVIRLSIGLEDPADLIADLTAALAD